ncbi:MAG: thiol reductant ABC exporter subunit CydC [Devosia sp.]
MRALLGFVPQFRRLGGPLLVSLALSLLTLAAGIALLGISGWFLTAAALSTAGAAFNLFGPSAGVRGLSFTRILSRYGEKLSGHDATLRLLSNLRRWLFERLLRLVPIGGRFGRADLVSRLVADLDALDTMFLVALGPITTAAVAGIAMTVVMAMVLPGAAVAYGLGIATVILAVPIALIAGSRRAASDAAAASAALRRSVLDAIDGHLDLVVFDATGASGATASDAALALAGARGRLARRGSLASAAVQLLTGGVLVATLIVGLAALGREEIEGPVLVGLLLGVVASFEASAVLVRSATRLAGSAAAAERLAAIAEAVPEIGEPAEPQPLPEGSAVAFEHVSFRYGERNVVLADVSFRISSGELVAIRGPSGSGKSTLAQLLVRLIEPQSGSVRVNGTDIATVASAALRRRVALMTQDAPVFSDTMRANLLIGCPEATEDQLWAALRRVRLETMVRALPQGLDTAVGEAGRTISAGQARRLCLARTILSPATILVLDEPTAGLDLEAEASLLSDLADLAGGRTLIVITHAAVPTSFTRTLTLSAGRLTG